MLKRILIYFLISIITIILTISFILLILRKDKIIDKSKTVYIDKIENGYQLIRNKNSFIIQGASGDSHWQELAEIGGNTIRLYDTINLANNLDQAQKFGLAVIVDIPIPSYNKNYNVYEDQNHNDLLKKKISTLINKHKNHPALLIWNLGNEINYPLTFFENKFIVTFNELIDIIHDSDANHPIGTSIPAFSKNEVASIHYHSPDLDILSFNTFGNIKRLSLFKKISWIYGQKPYYLSEWGHDGPWEAMSTYWGAPIEPTSTKKIEQLGMRYKIQDKLNGLGSLVFYWGQKQECTHTWFSLFGDNDTRSELINELEYIWKGIDKKPNNIGLDYMLLDGKGAASNIILTPNQTIIAEIIHSKETGNNEKIAWEIYQEGWHRDGKSKEKRPTKVNTSFKDLEKNKTIFVTPSKEGPYRIFAYIYDQNGRYATTNIPFYVLNDKSKPYQASK